MVKNDEIYGYVSLLVFTFLKVVSRMKATLFARGGRGIGQKSQLMNFSTLDKYFERTIIIGLLSCRDHFHPSVDADLIVQNAV